MMSLIGKHYSGRDASSYDTRRSQNPKWTFEQTVVERYLKGLNNDLVSILDAPIGTGRFCDTYRAIANIRSVVGLDFSDDMLQEASQQSWENLTLKKHNLIEDSVADTADFLVCFRFLNLLETQDALKVIKNTLPAIRQGGLISIRDTEDGYTGDRVLEGKIFLHPASVLIECISTLGFVVQQEHVYSADLRAGRYCVYQISRQETVSPATIE